MNEENERKDCHFRNIQGIETQDKVKLKIMKYKTFEV